MNCKVEHDLSLTKDSVSIKHHNNKTGVNVVITSTKRYVPVVALSIKKITKFSENLKQESKRTISWNEIRYEITSQQPKNNNLDYMIDSTFSNINRLFVLSFKSSKNGPKKDYFVKYYMPLVEIKDFNALLDNKPFLINP